MKSRRRLLKTERHRVARKHKRKMIGKGVDHRVEVERKAAHVPQVDMSWLPMLGFLAGRAGRKVK